MDVSADTLLGGRVAYCQPLQGYRTGIEPILLAAAIPARPGDRVLEAGTGAGAALLALCARVQALSGTGLERDAAMAELAARNLAANSASGIRVECITVEGFRPDGAYDHAFANPPWHDAASTPSPDAARRRAKIAGHGTLGTWIGVLAASLRHRGTLSLILPAAQHAKAISCLVEAKCGEISLLPLWPKPDHPAKLIILQAVRHGRGGSRILPGLVLHQPGGGYTPAAERVLKEGAPLAL
jgi:tRNA1(Val) A37 N6-methylase TrmN6